MAGDFDTQVISVARTIAAAGGRALLVGGCVRDRLLGETSKDYDFEVYGLELERLETCLRTFGEVIAVGKAFGVLRVKGLDIDFSIPRKDSKTGRGHRGFLVELDPALTFAEAATRRDLTINSMGLDPLTGELLDPHGGQADLRARRLRATDPAKFGEDSLRGLRVAQFHARFDMKVDEELHGLCSDLDLSDLPGERIFEEMKKLLLKADRPSLGLEFLRQTTLLRFFPELEAMVGVPQDPEWHPEGTVWEHTLLVVDEAAQLRQGDEDQDLVLLYGALCHDLGKPDTTVVVDGRVRSPLHEDVGVPIAECFLERLRAPLELTRKVASLVDHHLAPAQFIRGGATPKAYRRLARKLDAVGLTSRMLYLVARADHFGRTTEDALRRDFSCGEKFIEMMEQLHVEESGVPDAVLGRHLIELGYEPSPWFGEVLEACRDLQDETGWTDPPRILDRVLARLNSESEGGERPSEKLAEPPNGGHNEPK